MSKADSGTNFRVTTAHNDSDEKVQKAPASMANDFIRDTSTLNINDSAGKNGNECCDAKRRLQLEAR